MPCRPADGVVRVVGGEVSYVTTGRDLVLEPNGPRRTVVTLPDVIRGVWQGAAGGPVWVASGTETTWHFRRIRCAPQTLRMDDAIVRVHGPLASGYRCQEGDEDCDAVERAALLSKAPAARGLATILGGPSWHRAWDAHVLRLVADARGLDVDTAPEALVEALLHGADVLVRMYAPTISNTPVDPFRPSWLTALGHDDNATGGLRVVPIAAWYDEGLTRRPDWQVAWVVRDMHGESAVACPGQQVRLVLVKSFRRVRVVSDCMDVQ